MADIDAFAELTTPIGATASVAAPSDLDARSELTSPIGTLASVGMRTQNGLIHYWPLDGTAVDVLNGLQGEGGTSVPGLVGDALYVVSADNAPIAAYRGPDNLDYRLREWSISVVFFLSPDWPATYWPEIFLLGLRGGNRPHVDAYISRNTPNLLHVDFYNDQGTYIGDLAFTTSLPTLAGAPHLLTVTYDGATASLYVDGLLRDTLAAGFAITPQVDPMLSLGGYVYPANNNEGYYWDGWPDECYWDGWFDEFAIWCRALSAEEVAWLWRGGSGIAASTWPMAVDWESQTVLPSPIGAISTAALVDFSAVTGGATLYYAMELVGTGPTVRVPISSWQATLQTERSNYVQCVIPSAGPYLDAIGSQAEFVIYSGARLPGGQTVETEMARAPIQTFTYQQGPINGTCTLSGYSTGFAQGEVAAQTGRVLTGIRSFSVDTAGQRRVRANIDWLLRPGLRAIANEQPFVASYINYYVGSGQAYMDVGERAI
jgi:hypothetical protein